MFWNSPVRKAPPVSPARSAKTFQKPCDLPSIKGSRSNGTCTNRRCDLERFDPAPFEPVLEKVKAQGIHFVSLAELGDSQEARRKLYEVNYTTALDTPGYDGDWMPFEEFEQRICAADWYSPEGQIGALLGEEWVGMAAVRLIPELQGAYNLMTGVMREYRGRGIAQALKLISIDYAKRNGAKYIRTHNNSMNAPMLAVNRKFGLCAAARCVRGEEDHFAAN